MNRSVLYGGILIAGGALLALLPQFVLPVCSATVATASGGSTPMKCFWTARAEIGAGALIIFGGIRLCVLCAPGIRLGVSLMAAGTALLAMAFPTVLIGVCAFEYMPCRMGTLPGIMLVGTLVFAVSLLACREFYIEMKKETGK